MWQDCFFSLQTHKANNSYVINESNSSILMHSSGGGACTSEAVIRILRSAWQPSHFIEVIKLAQSLLWEVAVPLLLTSSF